MVVGVHKEPHRVDRGSLLVMSFGVCVCVCVGVWDLSFCPRLHITPQI